MSTVTTASGTKTNTEHILRDNKFVRRSVTEEVIGSAEDILTTLVEPAPVFIPAVHTLNQQPIHMSVANSGITMCTELKSLPINFGMTLNNNGTRLEMNHVEGFAPNWTAPGIVRVRDPWTPPPSLKVWLFLQCVSDRPGALPQAYKCYLLCRWGKGEFRAMTYPNVYDNGIICMGHDWEQNKNRDCPTVLEKFIRAYNSFHATGTNMDLVRDRHMELYCMDVTPEGEAKWHVFPSEDHYGVTTSIAFSPQFRAL